MLALLALLAGTALAGAPPPPDAPPSPSPVSSGDRRVGPFSRDTYPSEASVRPLVLPAGMLRADAALEVQYFRLTTTTWQSFPGLSLAFGITDRLELSASARFALAPAAARLAGVSGTFLVLDGTSLDLALRAGLELSFSGATPALAIALALPGRVLLNDRIFLTFGAELLRLQLAPALAQGALRLGLGAQVSSGVAILAGTDLAKLLTARTLPLDVEVAVAVARGFDVRVRAQAVSLTNPRLAGAITIAGSAYF